MDKNENRPQYLKVAPVRGKKAVAYHEGHTVEINLPYSIVPYRDAIPLIANEVVALVMSVDGKNVEQVDPELLNSDLARFKRGAEEAHLPYQAPQVQTLNYTEMNQVLATQNSTIAALQGQIRELSEKLASNPPAS